MDSVPSPLPPSNAPGGPATTPRGHERRGSPAPDGWAGRWEAGIDASFGWLHRLQDTLLIAVAIVMLLMGVFVLLAGLSDLVTAIMLRVQPSAAAALHGDDGPSVVEVAENALLALILAELVGTLLVSVRGRSLTVEPFLVIAVVAVIRHLLFVTVRPSTDPIIHTLELLGMGGLIVLLVAALGLLRAIRARVTDRTVDAPLP